MPLLLVAFRSGVPLAFLLTLLAGLSTGLGAILVLLRRRTDTRFLSLMLGFSAGAMIYLSFAELLPEARSSLANGGGEAWAGWMTLLGFAAGILVVALIDRFVPSYENPHDVKGPCNEGEPAARSEDLGIDWGGRDVTCARTAFPEALLRPGRGFGAGRGRHGRRIRNFAELEDSPLERRRLRRLAILTAIVMMLHNFPEGIATFMASLHTTSLGVTIAIAIALHNIPEGISVAIPLYYSSGSRRKAVAYTFLTGFAEPLGALLAYAVLRPFLSDALLGFIFAAVAGIMVYISMDELLPSSRAYGAGHDSMYGLVAGMLATAVSLMLL